MTDMEWHEFRGKVLSRQIREKRILDGIEDCLTVCSGAVLVILLCGFCWLWG